MNVLPTQKNALTKGLYAVLLLLIGSISLIGQDLHYSQFYLNPMHLSPAATGMFHGDIRASALYRSQWKNVPVAYKTYAGAVEWKALERGNNLLSVGLMLQNDKAGDAALSWLQVGTSLSVAHALNEQHAISLGFGAAFIQRRVDISGLTFKNQWGGDVFDPSRPSGEAFNSISDLVPSFSTGMNWYFKQSEARSQIDLGAGLSHVNRPVVSLGGFEERLPSRISCYSNIYWQVQEQHDLVFVAAFQEMGKAQELLFGAGVRRILTTGLANNTSLQLTISNRLNDAIIPAIQVERNNWILGISYDINISPFETATNGRGGIEIAAIWRRIPVPLLKTVKSCPIF